ncbi:hypothetical protein FM110_12905 [Brachybacterium nesterenkovii]|uniref:Uncharacterized protein n=1 Tax=Brachybacterium nesterenkovii TaxID=47847 RepID=A0A1X6X8N5_9MICO|nr:hypothetical protein FM110_12905 [Brachybacterium nesterenkovii]
MRTLLLPMRRPRRFLHTGVRPHGECSPCPRPAARPTLTRTSNAGSAVGRAGPPALAGAGAERNRRDWRRGREPA